MALTLDGTAGITFPSGSGTQAAQSKVLQVVMTTNNTTVSLSNGSYYSQLDTSITPLFSTSKVLIMVTLGFVGADSAADLAMNITRGSTALQQGTGGSTNSTYSPTMNVDSTHGNVGTFVLLDSPSTTSSTTYRIQALPNTPRTMYINRRGADTTICTSSTMILMEIAA